VNIRVSIRTLVENQDPALSKKLYEREPITTVTWFSEDQVPCFKRFIEGRGSSELGRKGVRHFDSKGEKNTPFQPKRDLGNYRLSSDCKQRMRVCKRSATLTIAKDTRRIQTQED